ncbi:MAG: DUF1016 N-terminal domain-containing protein [Candidatus Woesearchaeota archaeon]|nr:DUF1016 N-terminal domain-containing protein [Candidatus Woesearchaeota archaeon]
MKKLTNPKDYSSLITDIGSLLEQGRKQAYQAVNTILVRTYWEIGKRIVEFEQHGKEKAEYGSALLENLSKDLKLRHGKGFSKSNLIYMRLFYLKYKKSETLSHQLSWSHYFELLKIEDDLERSFYEIELSKKRQVIETAKDLIKDPYVLEFLKIPEDYSYSEKELEQKIIDNSTNLTKTL